MFMDSRDGVKRRESQASEKDENVAFSTSIVSTRRIATVAHLSSVSPVGARTLATVNITREGGEDRSPSWCHG